ncbi:sorting nexin-20 isoform X2 [Eptesicus fuscus]|uniref:sorting nexin-20 isoform X2 n=1 Tax=Eptesicus fuscus TaxID=29078 RepID=UPI0024042C84|nr:sorting nexin-20 isoform X2 [Eptesicus fuscus]
MTPLPDPWTPTGPEAAGQRRRRGQPERPLQHDHAGAAGVLEGREGRLEAREAALRDRLGPHRGGDAVQMYQVVVIQTGSFDSTKAVLERRYSDFQTLQRGLLRAFPEEIEDVAFPKKHLLGNFEPELIAARTRAFREYLRQLYAIRCVRRSREFIDFLTRPELREAFGCLRAGQYVRALDILGRALPLQEKLTGHCPAAVVPALCAALVCHRELERPLEAFAAGERALERLRAREGHRYYAPLLDAMVRLAYALGKDFVSLQERLEDSQLRRPSPRGLTLKELAVREYLG